MPHTVSAPQGDDEEDDEAFSRKLWLIMFASPRNGVIDILH